MKRIAAAFGLTIASTSFGAAADLSERIYTKTPASTGLNYQFNSSNLWSAAITEKRAWSHHPDGLV